MLSSRAVSRATVRALRAPAARSSVRNVRFASTEQKTAAATGGSSGLVGGLGGGLLVFLAGYGYYHFSGAKSIVNAASSTKKQYDALTQKLSSSAPEPNEALKWLRSTATSYAVFIPGAKSYIDSAFNDLDKVQAKHSKEVEEIVSKAYSDLKSVSSKGMSIETATRGWEILENTMKQLGELAADSASEILDNHPQIKERFGGNLDQLKRMAENGGEDAKKELETTYNQLRDVVKGGFSADMLAKVKKVLEEKTQKIQKLGDEAWKTGLEQAKPYLEKSPKVKEIVESNADALKQGNLSELWDNVKEAASSGNTDKLQDYVKNAGEKAKQSGVGKSVMGYAKMIPGGDEILPKLMKLQDVAQKRGGEAEKILKQTWDEVKDVLQKKIGEVEKLEEKVKKDAKD